MGLKNWTVRTQQIKKGRKGLSNHSGYLMSNKAKAHENTKIEVLGGSHSAILQAHEQRQKQRQQDGLRGGGVRNLATSFVLTLPKQYGHPDSKQWKKTLQPVFKAIGKELDIDPRQVAKHAFAVVHDESDSNKNSHVHLLISNVIDGKYHKKLTQKKVTAEVKNSYNIGVKNTLGINYKNHTPENPNTEYKDLWLCRKEKSEKAALDLKAATNENIKIGKALRKEKLEVKEEKEQLAIEIKESKAQMKVVNRFMNAVEKFEKAADAAAEHRAQKQAQKAYETMHKMKIEEQERKAALDLMQEQVKKSNRRNSKLGRSMKLKPPGM